ncbi:MAG: hypothetical protein IJW57_04115 [Spirochaetaceae bacterium]|nr:hypothetical protein [Spirochaetaceae bacterium]
MTIEWSSRTRLLWKGNFWDPENLYAHDKGFVIQFQDGTQEYLWEGDDFPYDTPNYRHVPVDKCLKKGFTAPQNEIAKFLTGRIDQLVMFRKYNKKKRTNPKNPDAKKRAED